jgi:hypothetical protein
MVGVGIDGYSHFCLSDNGTWGVIANYVDPNAAEDYPDYPGALKNVCSPCYYTLQMYSSSLCPGGMSSQALSATVTSPSYAFMMPDGSTVPTCVAFGSSGENGSTFSSYYMPPDEPAYLDAVAACQSDGHTVLIVTNRSSASIDTMVEFQGVTIDSSTTADISVLGVQQPSYTSCYYGSSPIAANRVATSIDNMLEACNLQQIASWDVHEYWEDPNYYWNPLPIPYGQPYYPTTSSLPWGDSGWTLFDCEGEHVGDDVFTEGPTKYALSSLCSSGTGQVNGVPTGWLFYAFKPYSITTITIPSRE